MPRSPGRRRSGSPSRCSRATLTRQRRPMYRGSRRRASGELAMPLWDYPETGPEAYRVAEVLVITTTGRSVRGSGYRVTGAAVLTAAHVVRDAAQVWVRCSAD